MPNEEGLYSKEEWTGLLADKQGEVRSRQQTQAELATSQAEIATLSAKIKALEAKPKEIENPSDVVTRKELIEKLEAQKKELTEGYQADKQNMSKEDKEAAIDASFEEARGIKTEEKMGKGLDFDSVWEGCKRYLKKNPNYKAVITGDKNPGEKAYEIGLLDETIAKRVALDKKNFPDQERKQKVGLESTDTPGQYFSQERVAKMEKPEIEANLEAIRESQKKWKK